MWISPQLYKVWVHLGCLPCANSPVFNSLGPHKPSKQDYLLQIRKPWLGAWVTCLLSSRENVMRQHPESTGPPHDFYTVVWTFLWVAWNISIPKVMFTTAQREAPESMVQQWPRMLILQNTKDSHTGAGRGRKHEPYRGHGYLHLGGGCTAHCLNADHIYCLAFACKSLYL